MRRRRMAAAASAAVGASLLVPAVGHAHDFTVTNLDDSGTGSLRDAVTQANADTTPDRILFQAGLSGAIDVSSGTIQIGNPVEIDGPADDPILLEGDGNDSLFTISTYYEGAAVTIKGLEMRHGGDSARVTGAIGGAIDNSNANLTVADSKLVGNRAYLGGAIFSSGPLTVEHTTIRGNYAHGQNFGGGGIDTTYGLTISDSTVADNGSEHGAGGGIAASGNSSLHVTDSTVTGNFTGSGNMYGPARGAGIAAFVPATITDSTISGNRAVVSGIGASGGGVIAHGDLTVTGSTVANNTAAVGAGIDVYGGSISLTRSTVAGNSGRQGAGLAVKGSDATVDGTTISGNRASGGAGGGVLFSDYSHKTLSLSNSTVSGNTADFDGGGIYDTNYLTSSDSASRLRLDSVTVANNQAGGQGGGIAYLMGALSPSYTAPPPTLRNTIVAGNTAASGGRDIDTPTPFDASFSLIQDAPASAFTSSPSNIVGQDPQLGALADNGGPTPTMALGPGSPAVDRGSTSLTTDQRGLARPGGPAADIGAFELQPSPQPPGAPPAPPGPPGQPSPAGPGVQRSPAPPLPKIRLRGRIHRRKHGVTLTISCAQALCHGSVRLVTTERVRTSVVSLARAHRNSVKLGSRSYSIAAGKRRKLTVNLNRTGRSLLRRFHRLPLRVAIVVSSNGHSAVATTKRVVLKRR